jgi:hypothetical protein
VKMSKVLDAIKAELKKPLPEPRVVVTKKERKKVAKKAKKVEEDDEDTGRDESDEDEGDEEEEEEEEKPAKKGKKKPAKAAKKSSKKASKSDDDDSGVSIQDLAEEAGINAQSARVKLRDAELGKPEGGRWRWKEGSKALKEARKALGL